MFITYFSMWKHDADALPRLLSIKCLWEFLSSSPSMFQSMWIERTTFTTVYKLPGILRWFEATDVKHVRFWESLVRPHNGRPSCPQLPFLSLRWHSPSSSRPPCRRWKMRSRRWIQPMRRFSPWSTSIRPTGAFPSIPCQCCSTASWTQPSWEALPSMRR